MPKVNSLKTDILERSVDLAEKLIGKCKKRNIVYETECMTCKGGEEEIKEREEEEKEEKIVRCQVVSMGLKMEW